MDDNFDVMQLEHDDDDPERVEEQLENEKKLEARYQKLVGERGIDDEETLNTFFALFDNCIQLYRLNKLSDYLEQVVPVCRKRGDKFYMKGIQALAFVRWKQSRFREALPLFHEMEGVLGKSAALCENIAHTYNSLGEFEKAEDYLRQALKFIEQESGMNKGNRGGVLLGLGIVRDRLGKHKEALPVCVKAYEFYKERANGAPASLQAKAGISCAKIHAKLGDLKKAESYIREAVEMYEITCGETSPLTASAYHELGKCLWGQRRREDAQKALKRAYELEAMKDAWDLVTLLEVHNLLMDTHLKETANIDRAKFADYFATVEYVVGRVRKELPQDGNAAVYYKAAAELKSWGGRYKEAKELFDVAIPLLKAETSTDCTSLLETCEAMKAFCDRNLEGTQDSPMNFALPAEKGSGESDDPGAAGASSSGEYQGPIIEDITDEVEVPAEASAAAAASSSGPSSSAAPKGVAAELRCLTSSDAAEASKLCSSLSQDPLFSSANLKAHLEAAGAGLCWAVAGERISGVALCGSDGVFGNLLQLAVEPCATETVRDTKKRLIDRCQQACHERGLRGLRATLTEEDDTFKDLGWKAQQTWFSDDRPDKKSRTGMNGSAVSSTSPAPSDPKLRRDGKDVKTYYQAWDKVNVDRALVAEEGLDPAAGTLDLEREQLKQKHQPD
ncbi:Kinesin light chain 2 (KLC 2) [Durusdinium trenchii]|uniref:Kinesin light chain 2 (KLC 2) n=1 Tax=Durusdinium trenchii TaxID=1381693 RepID=A0ABP0K405_9DINO